MSATLQRPTSSPAPADEPSHGTAAFREDLLMVATIALLVAACLPLTRVYVGLAFLRPIYGAVLLALGLAWGARRLGAGPVGSLLVSIAGWAAFVSAAFLSDTLFAGIIPTGRTVGAGATLWARGIELMQLRPAPAFAEAGMMFITITGVWAITHAVEGLVFRIGAPLKAVVMALALWTVPLAVAPPTNRAWPWAVPFLAAAALLMLSFAGTDLRRWGAWTPAGRDGSGRVEPTLLPAGGVLAIVAIVAGAVLAGVLPGFGDAPWYQVRGMGGPTLTTNPIVDIRTRLVAQDSGPVMRVVTDRPVYLRTTALDVYSEAEEWTNTGIRGAPIDGNFPLEVPLGPVERVRLDVAVENLPKAVLVPTPYQALSVSGPIADEFQYDTNNSTVTLDSGTTLRRGDEYSIVAAIPSPTVEQLDAAVVSDEPGLVQLPANVPGQVRQLAADIVEEGDAQTPFEQALAVQSELRSWQYSVQPSQGHGGQAMLTFITNRIGYCEQYAGTMAVMLRSLGLPARVAVGYTPGTLVDGESNAFTVTNANAHAWVEVLFEGLGWVAFEPTPRSDGNVLVPSATNVAPSRTAADLDDLPEDGTGFEAAGPDQELLDRQNPGGQATEVPSEVAPGGPGGAGGGGAGGIPPVAVVLGGLLGVAAVAAGVASTRGHHDLPGRPPLERVLHARAEIEQLGRGMGITPAAWETDTEYLQRVAHRHGKPARAAAAVLGAQTARARYARDLAEQSAVEAEHAAAQLQTEIFADRSGIQRGMIRLRGRTSALLARVRAAIRQLSSSSRRRAESK